MKHNLRHLCEDYTSSPGYLLTKHPKIDNNKPVFEDISSQIINQCTCNHTIIQTNNECNLLQLDYQNKCINMENIDQNQIKYNQELIQERAQYLRKRIIIQTKQSDLVIQKLQGSISQVIQRLKFKGKSIAQLQIKKQKFMQEQSNLKVAINQAQRINVYLKQKYLCDNKNMRPLLQSFKRELYSKQQQKKDNILAKQMNNSQQLIEIDQQCQYQYQKLYKILQSKLNKKNTLKQQLIDIKNNTFIIRQEHHKIIMSSKNVQKNISYINNRILTSIDQLQRQIVKKQSDNSLQAKKLINITRELSEKKVKFQQRRNKMLDEIHKIHQRIIAKHSQMANINLQIEIKKVSDSLKCSKIHNLESEVELLKQYLNSLYQNSKNIGKYGHQDKQKWDQCYQQKIMEILEKNISKLESAVQQQQKRRKVIQNNYQKLKFQLEQHVKTCISRFCNHQ